MISVLFVCLGNICRSPMAESVFAQMLEAENLADKIRVDSAGTGDWHVGDRPHAGTLAIISKYGLREGSRARTLHPNDYAAFNYMVVMDEENLKNVQKMLPSAGKTSAEVNTLLAYALETGVGEVPDPYFTGDFEQTYALVDAGCRGLLSHIKSQHSL